MNLIKKNKLVLLLLVLFSIGCNSKIEDEVIEDEEIKPEVSGYSVEDALENKKKGHFKDDDEIYDLSNMTFIFFSDEKIVINGGGAVVKNKAALISQAGVYYVSGQTSDGRIVVEASKEDKIQIILDNADIAYKNGSPFFINSCKRTTIILADNSDNYLTDSNKYTYDLPDDKEPNATLFGKDDFTICGKGKLSITGRFNDAIGGKDGLVIKDATISLFGSDDGIQIKDYLIIDNAKLDIRSIDDGIKISEDANEARGYFYMKSGEINITSGGDGIQVETDLLIADGKVNILAGDGHTFINSQGLSLKGFKAVDAVIIDKGNITIDSADDAINSKGIISINGGTFDISTGDDAMHADVALGITDGEINISTCKDGLEGNIINIQGGEIDIFALSDGINVLNEKESLKTGNISKEELKKSHFYLSGGKISIKAMDDGIDVFDTFIMQGGEVKIYIPEDGDKALDIKENLIIEGGYMIATQPDNMILLPIEKSIQKISIVNLDNLEDKNTTLSIENNSGLRLYKSEITEKYKSFLYTSPELKNDEDYKVLIDDVLKLTFNITDLFSFVE